MVSVNLIGKTQTNYLHLIPNLSDEDINRIFEDDFTELRKNIEKKQTPPVKTKTENKQKNKCWISRFPKFSFKKNSSKNSSKKTTSNST